MVLSEITTLLKTLFDKDAPKGTVLRHPPKDAKDDAKSDPAGAADDIWARMQKVPAPSKPKGPWISAGGVVLDSMDDLEHIYVRWPTNNYGPPGFPKGMIDKGESMEKAALREVEEEIGLKCRILPNSYLGAHKGSYSITHYFLMVRTGGSTAHHDKETAQVALVTWGEALKIFGRAGNHRDINVIDEAIHKLQQFKKEEALRGVPVPATTST